jgi:hypothetical protein
MGLLFLPCLSAVNTDACSDFVATFVLLSLHLVVCTEVTVVLATFIVNLCSCNW